MSIIHLQTEDFKDLIANELVLVDFYANWCGPCKMLSPILEDVAKDLPDTDIIKIDVDQFSDIAISYNVMSIPTLVLFKKGNPIAIKQGFMPKELLKNWINENK